MFCLEMYTQCSSVNLRLHEQPLTSYIDSTVLCDRSLTCEFPLSPNSQLMYESEPLQDQCCVARHAQPDQSVVETRVISPSVEGLTFNDYDVLSYVFANEQLPAAAASSTDDAVSNTTVKYLSDAWKMTDRGPTLTQLNSEDLDATLLDDFGVSSSGFCVDMSSLDCSQLIAANPAVTNTMSMPSTAVTLSSWSEQMRQQQEETVHQQQQQQQQQQQEQRLMSHVLNSQKHIDSVSPATRAHASASSASSTATTTQLSLDRNWEAIESFLKSEDERMAAEASKQQQLQLQLAANIKSEASGI